QVGILAIGNRDRIERNSISGAGYDPARSAGAVVRPILAEPPYAVGTVLRDNQQPWAAPAGSRFDADPARGAFGAPHPDRALGRAVDHARKLTDLHGFTVIAREPPHDADGDAAQLARRGIRDHHLLAGPVRPEPRRMS